MSAGALRRATGALLVAVCLAATGCGYALEGRGITTDPSVKRIGVPLFKDRTGKLGLDARVTAAVIEELLKRGRFTVVKDAENVDAVVEGEILSYNSTPVNVSAIRDTTFTQASRYTTTLVARVVYRKIGQPEPIWENDSYSQRDEFDLGEAGAGFVDREDQSIERLADSFARGLVAAMLEAF